MFLSYFLSPASHRLVFSFLKSESKTIYWRQGRRLWELTKKHQCITLRSTSITPGLRSTSITSGERGDVTGSLLLYSTLLPITYAINGFPWRPPFSRCYTTRPFGRVVFFSSHNTMPLTHHSARLHTYGPLCWIGCMWRSDCGCKK